MGGANAKWVLREDLKASVRLCKAFVRFARRKMPKADIPAFAPGDRVVSATRFWGYRVTATLAAVHGIDSSEKSCKEKTLTFSELWHDDEVPGLVMPLIVSEKDSVAFSPITNDALDYGGLDSIPDEFAFKGRLRLAISNFYDWAVAELSKDGALAGFRAEVRVERYLIGDRVTFDHDASVRAIWVNRKTDQAWVGAEAAGAFPWFEKLWSKMGEFVLPMLVTGLAFWLATAKANAVSLPPVVNVVGFGFSCAAMTLVGGLFLRGWLAKLVIVAFAFVGALPLVPWVGESWDLTSDLVLAMPVVSGEWAGAPIGSTYIACTLLLSMLALAIAPSLALKTPGGWRNRIIAGVVFGLAVSPWPRVISSLEEVSAAGLRLSVCLFVLLGFALIGDFAAVVSPEPRGADAETLIARLRRMSRPSLVSFGLAALAVAVLLYNQIRIMG